MESALVRPPLPSYTAITPEARAPERIEPAAKTELSAGSTVNPSAEADQGRRTADNQRSQEPLAQNQQIDRRNFRDPESDSLIYIATDSDTGEVVQQVPSETLRRLRAYAKTISDQANEARSENIVKTA
ncbi:hypothetical protein DYI23_08220 [Roseibium polysiphoniae]|uniref:Flagellar protein FlaG n=1 Tax=Roseibium polysiphoniae TaxID=2571221 RepID=A0A944GSD7_9HYPH|nr:hypothetical protein [Roseibium polysiphoniae]MBS8260199.1 hypothetical protein [Roseibium polysiphoniae]